MYLEEYADENFSGFEGEEISAYTGENDDFMDFAGPGVSFANEASAGRSFNVVIQNNNTTPQKVVLFNGFKNNKLDTGEILAVEGTTADLTVTSYPSTINELVNYLQTNPAHLGWLKITSTNAQQIEQSVTVEELSPFKKLGSREIFLSAYANENTFRDNMVTVPTPGLIVGAETKISLIILQNSTVTITLFFGGVLSNSVALKNKYRKSVSSINAVGIGKVLRAQTIKRGLPQ